MGWKCDGCGATVGDSLNDCDYCGRHRVIKTQHVPVNQKYHEQASKPSDALDKISSSLDPVQNYQTLSNSVKPNFENKESVPVEKIVIGFIVFVVILWLIN